MGSYTAVVGLSHCCFIISYLLIFLSLDFSENGFCCLKFLPILLAGSLIQLFRSSSAVLRGLVRHVIDPYFIHAHCERGKINMLP